MTKPTNGAGWGLGMGVRLKRGGGRGGGKEREEVGVSCCRVVAAIRSSWNPLQASFLRRRGGRRGGRGHLPVCAALAVFSRPRAVRRSCLALRGSTAALRRPRSSALPLAVGFSAATLSRPTLPFSAVFRRHLALPSPFPAKFVSLG